MTAWHEYAEGVKNGKITACKRLKQAVKRYFSDLENPLYTFDPEVVERFIAFSRVCPHVKGAMRGSPIELEPWQQFAFACILGFKVKATGRRKYTSAFIEVPRKNAKSTVAAILANWFLVMENGQQDIYTAAVSRDQARIVFDDARQMCLLSRPLRKRVNIQAHKVIHPKTNSLLKPLAAKAATIEGTNPSLAIVDEYHLHPDNGVYSTLELGMGARPEGLLFAITTSGSNVVSACKQHYDYCCQILDGEEVNESMFVLIYELDDESEVDDPAMWIQGAGFEVEPFPQTYLRFSPAAKSFEVFVNRKVIVHRGDPVLAWSMSNVVMQSDANANIKPNKKKSSNKIDPSVAALMAFGTFQAEHEEFAFDISDSHKERLAAFDGV